MLAVVLLLASAGSQLQSWKVEWGETLMLVAQGGVSAAAAAVASRKLLLQLSTYEGGLVAAAAARGESFARG